MQEKEKKADTLHIYQSAHRLIPGAVYWYGEDYPSFSEALDRCLPHIKTVPLKDKLEICLHLNSTTISSNSINEWKNFYCAEKNQEYASEQVLLKRQGYNFLWKCLFLLWLCLTGAYGFDQLHILSEYSQMLGRETFFLFGWVILWKPIEMILFEPWALKHQLRLIEKLKHATLTQQPYENSFRNSG